MYILQRPLTPSADTCPRLKDEIIVHVKRQLTKAGKRQEHVKKCSKSKELFTDSKFVENVSYEPNLVFILKNQGFSAVFYRIWGMVFNKMLKTLSKTICNTTIWSSVTIDKNHSLFSVIFPLELPKSAFFTDGKVKPVMI